MKRKQKLEDLKKKIDNKTASDTDYKMFAYLTRLSGMKGFEKSLKDRIGNHLNAGEHTYKAVDKVFDRINNRGQHDS